MNVAQAVDALDAAAEEVVSFALRGKTMRQADGFALMWHEVTPEMVAMAQAAELKQAPDLPLVASAGMKPGTHAVLIQVKAKELGHTVWMSTHEAEKTTQAEFVAAARGRVMVAGLGIGLVLRPLLSKPEVTQVVVIEKNMEVYRIMRPELERIKREAGPNRLRIVNHDVFHYTPGRQFDTIYFDVWPNITPKNMIGMLKLRQRFKRHLAPGGWMGCWAEAECRESLRRMEAKHPQARRTLEIVDKVYGEEGVVLSMCQIDEGASL